MLLHSKMPDQHFRNLLTEVEPMGTVEPVDNELLLESDCRKSFTF